MKRLLLLLVAFCFVAGSKAQLYRNEWIDYGKTYKKFQVYFGIDNTGFPQKKGLVRIYQTALAAAGYASTLAEDLQLWKDGTEVPIFTSVATGVLTSSDYIEFWGEINNGKMDNDLYRDPDFQLSDMWSLQTDTASYFLTTNPGMPNKRLVATVNSVAGNSLPATEYFMASSAINFRNLNGGFFAQATQPLHSSSYDRGEGFTTRSIRPIGSSCGQVSFTVNMTGLKPYLSGPTSFVLKMNATGNANNSRTVLVKLNGDVVSNFQMDYNTYAKVEEYGLDINKLASGTASVQYINESPVDCDEFKVAKTEIVYPRSLDGSNATSLELTLPTSFTGHYLKFYNFNYGTTPPVLYDLTNGKRYVGDLSIADTIQFVTEANFSAASFVLVKDDNSNALNISSFQQRNFIDFSNAANQGDYLIISNPLIYGTGGSNYVEQYRQYRVSANGGSFNAKVVDINELTDQFAYGVKKHPLSIRNFLRYARNGGFATAPKFAFLIGKAVTYDQYRSNEGSADIEYLNLVPTWGTPASDNLLSADNNLNATPITPIGRLSAVTANEVGDYLLKVKQYDSLQRLPSTSIADKAWMKNVLQVAGANDATLANQLNGYLARYKTIIEDTLFGGKAKSYDKIDDPSGYSASLRDFKSKYETGASIVTYFGHSSSSNLDFSLDNPSSYSNQYRYPLFIVNGCDAGNFFTYDPQRFNVKSTISEKFILAPERGAIGYMASTGFGIVNYLDSFTRKFYRNIARIQYNQPFGDIVKKSIGDVLNNANPNDYYARIHAEQFVFHGDPAIKVNGFDKADYATEAAEIIASPSFISVADDSFYVKVKVYNIGRKTSDSVSFKLNRQYPDGTSSVAYTKTLAPITSVDSITIPLPIVANRDKGVTTLTVVLDEANTVDEVTETNNTASINVTIVDDEIRPVYPYKYAIVTNPTFKLAASTANPLAISKDYVVEVDTTSLFNSPLKYTQTKTSAGGVLEFDNGITLQDGKTYYWRVALQGSGQHWNVSSFTYRSQPNVGFTQQHFYQHTESNLNRLVLDTPSRAFQFQNKVNNLFVQHSIYPTSGTEDQQFSIQVNGSGIIASACLGQSVIVNVFDTLTFKPWVNTTNPFNAEPTCADNRKYNFEYWYVNYDDAGKGRKSAYDFLNSIPNGMYVAVRLVYDWDNVWADEWAADTTFTGNHNTLYHFLKGQGLAIDSFNKARTFGFIFKKNDSTNFSPKYRFSDGPYDRVLMSVDCNIKDTLGYATSPKFGPAKAWKNVKWNGASNVNDIASVDVLGINNAGTETKLYTLATSQQDVDISSTSAAAYPYIKLKLKTQDSVTAVPYQLSNWSVEYDAVPEGAIAPNLYMNMPDTVGTSFGDTLRVGVAFKNVSKVGFDSLSAKLIVTSPTGTVQTINLPKLKTLAVGDTVHVDAALPVTTSLEGKYNVQLIVNPDTAQLEQYHFNNFVYKYIYFKTGYVDANHYYAANTGALHLNSSWGANPDGTGGRPLNFTGTNKIFELANRSGVYDLQSNLFISGSLIVPSSSLLNIHNNSLSIGKNLTNNGAVIGNGNIVLNGTASQVITGIGSINNLELNNTAGATIAAGEGNQLSIIGTYTPTNGLLTTNGKLVLFSSSNGTGRIGVGNVSGNYITGNVQVQRYIPGGYRKFRFLGHPFAAPMALSELTDDIDITGSISGSNANGFTASGSNSPSAFHFNETNDDGVLYGNGNNSGWSAYTSSSSASLVNNGQGIRVLIRGTKGQAGSLTGGAYTPDSVIMKMNGEPRQGDFTMTLNYTDAAKGWNLVSNPYPSNIDWDQVSKTDVNDAVYTYRPSYNGGVYASYVNGSSTNGGSNVLESSSSFFVRTTTPGASLDFHESDKIEDAPLATMFRTNNVVHNRLKLQLSNDSLQITDEAVLRFGGNSATDLFDKKLDAFNLAVATDLFVLDTLQKKYSIFHGTDLKAMAQERREVPLGLSLFYTGKYSITAKTLDAFVGGHKVYLKDKELDVLTEITDSIKYSFTVPIVAAAANRFSIVFNALEKTVVPVIAGPFTVKVSPNPASESMVVSFAGTDEANATTIRITSSNGAVMKTVQAGNVVSGNHVVNIASWASGMYIVELVNGKTRQTITVAKQQK